VKFGDYSRASEFKAVPAGTHVGVVTGLAFLGLQPGSQMYPEPSYKLALTVSFPSLTTDDGKQNLDVTSQYTFSTSKKATLRKMIEAINGPFADEKAVKAFDLRSLLGKAALFSVVHKAKDDKVFANLGGVIALPAGMPVPPVLNSTRYFTPDLEPQEYLREYNALPEFLRKKWDERIPDENAAGGGGDEEVAV